MPCRGHPGTKPSGSPDAGSISGRMLDFSCVDLSNAVPVNLRVRKCLGLMMCLLFPWIPPFAKPWLLSPALHPALAPLRAKVSKAPPQKPAPCRSHGGTLHHHSRNVKVICQMV